jgi:hypothetical protein
MAGYSATSLLKKLGIKPGYSVYLIGEPSYYFNLLSPLPEGVTILKKESGAIDFIHWFITDKKTLEKEFATRKKSLKKDGTLWISWPKKASGVTTDVNENIIREVGLKCGLVDVKVCAVDDTWSGLKFVYRLADR